MKTTAFFLKGARLNLHQPPKEASANEDAVEEGIG
jgi:hypothetical protein